MRTSRLRRTPPLVIGAVGSAAMVATLAGLAPASGASPTADLRVDVPARVHFDAGRPLTGRSADAPGQAVAQYVRTHVAGGADGLQVTGSWSSHGVRQLRMEQHVAGLRVHDGYVKAAVDSAGRVLSVIENSVPASAPSAAAVDEGAALRAAVEHLYPGRAVSTAGAARNGTTTSYPQQAFLARPTVERVAVPTTSGGLAEGFEVTTWDADNQLWSTLVAGDGTVVDSVLRTADDESYNVFPEDPAKTRQTTVTVTDTGWLAPGPQSSRDINGKFVHAYLDAVPDNAPDAGGSAATNSFLSVFNAAIQPGAALNPDVAVQNLFYLNSLIHDTLATAGFTAAAGNFEAAGGDAVNAEAQDGSGTDNANFATPTDGQAPRMQMYLWNNPVSHKVVSGRLGLGGTGAEWAPQLDENGVSGPLARANPANACTTIAKVAPGSIVLADRGSCDFVLKALNAQAAGAAGIVVANNVDGNPIVMGGTSRKLTIPGVMISKGDGASLAKQPTGQKTTILKDPAKLMRDGDLDSDIVWHEYGHGLTWRMIGRMDGPLAGAIGEGMSDVLSVIVNDDPVIGEYSANNPAGIRRASYERYGVITYGDITGTEVHDDGELYGAIGWDLWKRYKKAGLGQSDILSDLVDGMNYTPAAPTFEEMREGILAGMQATSTSPGTTERSCMVWKSFADHGVGVGALGTVRGSSAIVQESFTVPTECKSTR